MPKKATGKKSAAKSSSAKSRKSGTAGKRSTQRRGGGKAGGLVARLRNNPALSALALAVFAIVATGVLSLTGGRDSLPLSVPQAPTLVTPRITDRPVHQTLPKPGQPEQAIPESKPAEIKPPEPKLPEPQQPGPQPPGPPQEPPPLTDVPPRSNTPLVVPPPPLDRPSPPVPLPVPEKPQVALPPSGKPGGDGWRKYAVPVAPFQNKPAIAIVIDDMGLDRKRSGGIAGLPAPLTLAWLPYASDLRKQSAAARARGHELMLHMPMEPTGREDPGPDALKVGLDNAEIQRRIRKALSSMDGFVGVNNHMGSRFTADRNGMTLVMREFRQRDLLWLDSRTTSKTVGPVVAREHRVPHLGRDVFLDNEKTVAAIRKQLAETERIARQRGSAIAIGHPYDATIQALAEWLPDARRRGFAIVPVSAFLRSMD